MERKQPSDYWNENIENWGAFYLDTSHAEEKFYGPRWLTALYSTFITPIEARLMTRRYELTLSFIERYVTADAVVADIGCGTGIFSVEMLKRGATVKAIDIAARSLDVTRTAVDTLIPHQASRIEYFERDVSTRSIPAVDVAIAMGVTPYVSDIRAFYGNILPFTKMFYCLVLDPEHWANRVRRLIPMLNVRNMHCFSRDEIDDILSQHHWRLVERRQFASGYLDIAERAA